MSGGQKNQTFFYMGADHGLAILIIAAIILVITTLVGTAFLLLTF